jgi:hypothetical protein
MINLLLLPKETIWKKWWFVVLQLFCHNIHLIYLTGIYKQLTKTAKHDTTLVAMHCTYCKSVIPFNHSALVKNPIDLASNFHASMI